MDGFHKSRPSYATLSHCWGKIEDKLVLTLENKDSWKREIPTFGQLKTFTDAIQVARQLGFYFIGIDSLCIIQNSKKDWQFESTQMSNVYKYSFCNITATAAKSDIEGCFYTRTIGDIVEPLTIEFQSELSTSIPKYPSAITVPSREGSPKSLKGRYELITREAAERWQDDIYCSAVNGRAWVFQEVNVEASL